MNSQQTPEPWTIRAEDELNELSGNVEIEYYVCSQRVCEHAIGKPLVFEHIARLECEPDSAEARLIVAAPKLLVTCENIANEMEHWKHEAPPTREMRQACIDELRAAIAQAKGQQ